MLGTVPIGFVVRGRGLRRETWVGRLGICPLGRKSCESCQSPLRVLCVLCVKIKLRIFCHWLCCGERRWGKAGDNRGGVEERAAEKERGNCKRGAAERLAQPLGQHLAGVVQVTPHRIRRLPQQFRDLADGKRLEVAEHQHRARAFGQAGDDVAHELGVGMGKDRLVGGVVRRTELGKALHVLGVEVDRAGARLAADEVVIVVAERRDQP